MKKFLLFYVLLIVLLLVLLFHKDRPLFKVGDCIRYSTTKNEFEPSKLIGLIERVDRVGRESYLLNENNDRHREVLYFNLQESYEKVDCLTGDPK